MFIMQVNMDGSWIVLVRENFKSRMYPCGTFVQGEPLNSDQYQIHIMPYGSTNLIVMNSKINAEIMYQNKRSTNKLNCWFFCLNRTMHWEKFSYIWSKAFSRPTDEEAKETKFWAKNMIQKEKAHSKIEKCRVEKRRELGNNSPTPL